jgi:hypothetical protein
LRRTKQSGAETLQSIINISPAVHFNLSSPELVSGS